MNCVCFALADETGEFFGLSVANSRARPVSVLVLTGGEPIVVVGLFIVICVMIFCCWWWWWWWWWCIERNGVGRRWRIATVTRVWCFMVSGVRRRRGIIVIVVVLRYTIIIIIIIIIIVTKVVILTIVIMCILW
ncbi:hypothetical protein MIMGU_mgv11b020142mg [Erythranthe guttata]|uniref:Transmembrane protein n=1 Tax=Erythranthe guttata TaxID=4155 RepID=A0A022RQS2_ERYGU|nr:hypothetical protein MIMGU_mgv11b020142mg [Erythranthe guttata]